MSHIQRRADRASQTKAESWILPALSLALGDRSAFHRRATYRVLRAGIAPLREVAEVTEFPEMLDGRVKTIHPRIAGGILAMRSKPEHMRAIAEHGIPPIDLVCVNLYEFRKDRSQEETRLSEELIENIDIGGPTMIRKRGSQELAGCRGSDGGVRLCRDCRGVAGQRRRALQRYALEASEEGASPRRRHTIGR